MKTLNLRSSEVANDVVRVATVAVVAVVLYAFVLGLQKTPVWQSMYSTSPVTQTVKLSNKKSCIMLAWQAKSGIAPSSMERLRCNEYFPATANASVPAFAENR